MVPEKAVVVTKKWRRKFCSGITKSESVSGISSINNIVLPLCQTYEEAQTPAFSSKGEGGLEV